MKKLFRLTVLFLLVITTLSCESNNDTFEEDNLLLENETLEKIGPGDTRIICSIEGVPNGYVIEEYLTLPRCPNFNLFLGRFNAAVVKKINTIPNDKPVISRAGAGCNDNYCIWIVGSKFEDNAYVDIRTATGSSIIGTYRGSNRVQYVNAQGQDVITLRLHSEFERNEFARRGLRIWVVNPVARKWADGRLVKRPRGGGIIDPPCNPICP